MKWKVGHWVFCEFKLQQIMEMEDERVTSVSDGYFRLCSHSLNDRCFPLTLEVKCISDDVLYCRNRIHKEGAKDLNFPDIVRWLEMKWAEACTARNNGDKKYSNSVVEEIRKFTEDIISASEERKKVKINGVFVFDRDWRR